ncbi:hypothetical protein [Mumia zhuanghuii]|uniref:Uncharacterized protein n=1 Tax=Mumia zhuanghuii TaxID=2585211 RepID=A0A5C4MIQ8_9ACTN|nr:hypothetical protein [Mumia zhuanghuii]TNC43776.1 hypothetical protein FHE65_17415 [Mumia zhuanghuii]TNC45006.1 hypothetical protein FHE65_15555 [Mumia zhuanghuii]
MVMHPHNWALLAYTLASLALVAVLVVTIRRGWAYGIRASILPLLVTIGLAYDNALLTFGASWGESAALEAASYPRYLMHALFTPLLVLYAARVARRWDVTGFRSRRSLAIWAGLTTGIVALGLSGEIGMHLTPVTTDGVLSYKHLDSAPPFAEIATITALIVIGIMVARQARRPWILVGAAQMFVVAAAAASNAIVTNLGEILLLTSMALTACEVVRRAAGPADATASDKAASVPTLG